MERAARPGKLITLDGSRFFSSESVHCDHCLSTTSRGITSYHHDILQAAIVHPDKRQVFRGNFVKGILIGSLKG